MKFLGLRHEKDTSKWIEWESRNENVTENSKDCDRQQEDGNEASLESDDGEGLGAMRMESQ